MSDYTNYTNPADPGTAAPFPGPVSSDDKLFAIFAHLGTIIGSFLIPLIIWIVKKDDSKFVDYHGKEALNFQITIFIGYVIGFLTTILVIGFFILIACWVLSLVCAIIAALRANEGKAYRYPLTWRIIK